MAEKEEGAAPKANQKGVFTDIKNQLIESNQHQLVTATAVQELSGSFQKMIIQQDQSRLDQLEKDRESAQKVAAGQASLNSATSSPDAGKASGGMGGILGKLLGGGAALAIGGALGAAAAAIVAILNIDTKKVKSSVKDLLSISDELGGVTKAFVDGGTFLAVMTGIGLGLAVFGVGSAIAGMSAALLDNFASPTWAQDIIDNVLVFMSLKDHLGGDILEILGSAGTFLAVMTGLGMGLAIFGIGSSVAGMSNKLLDKFAGKGWAQSIVDNVVVFMSLNERLGPSMLENLGKAGVFLGVMTGVGLGLAVFAAGSAVAGALTYFQDPNFAQSIVDSVVTLLSISKLMGGIGDTLKEGGTFFVVMTAIGAGLAVFGTGTAVAGIAQKFAGTDFAQKTKDAVATLLSIPDAMGKDPVAQSAIFTKAMAGIGAGLAAFAGGQMIGSLANAGEALLGFFGAKSPFEKIMDIVDQRDQLVEGADAMDRLSKSITKMGYLEFDGSNLNLTKFAEDLKDAVPIIEAAIMGEQPGMIWGKGLKGLASPDIKYDEAVANIQKIQSLFISGEEMKASKAGIDEAGGGSSAVVAPVTNNYYNTTNNNYLQGSSQAKAIGQSPMDRRRSMAQEFR